MLSAPLSARAADLTADLTVRLDGVRDSSGRVRVVLFDRPEGFRKEAHPKAIHELPASPGSVSVRFPGLAAGRYAIMAYHDEDGDGTLDRFLGMVPTEGYGLSNNPVVTGPPAFDKAA